MSDIKPQLPLNLSGFLRGLGRLLRAFFKVKILWIPTIILIIAWSCSGQFTTYVPPGYVGIKQVYYGSSAGIRSDVLGPGLHWITPGTERIHLIPRDMQVVNFSDSPSEVSKNFRQAPSIKIQTSDGYNVQLDVSVLYRLEDPYKVFTETGPGRAFEDQLVIPRADRILRKTLGELNAEEFYQGPKRIDKANSAFDQLTVELKGVGIHVDGVLVRAYTYDQKYQEIIESRKIKDQTVYLRQAETKAAIEERKRDTIISEGKATVNVELARGEGEVKKLHADAELYRRKKEADGRLLVDLADAKGTELENTALQGAGSENMVGLKMAEVLKGIKVLVLPSDGVYGMNPLDLGSMLKKFEVQ